MKEIEGDETLPPTYPLNLSILSKLPIPASDAFDYKSNRWELWGKWTLFGTRKGRSITYVKMKEIEGYEILPLPP